MKNRNSAYVILSLSLLAFSAQASEQTGTVDPIQEAFLKLSEGKEWSGYDCATIMKALGNIKPERLDGVAQAYSTLPKGKKWNGNDRADIIKQLGKIQPERLNGIQEACSTLSTGKEWSGFYIGNIVKTLGEIQPERLEGVAQAYSTVSKGKEWAGKDCASIIEALGEIQPERLEGVAQAYSTVSKGKKWRGFYIGNIIKALRIIQPERLEDVVTAYSTVSKGKEWGRYDLLSIIKTLGEIQPERLDDALKAWSTVSKGKEWNGWDCADIIKALGKIQSERIEAALKAWSTLSEGKEWNIDDLSSIIKALGAVQPGRLEDVLTAWSTLSEGKKWRIIDNVSIIKALGKVQPGRLEDVVTAFSILSEGKEWGGYYCTSIIEALEKIQPERLEGVAQAYSTLSKREEWNGNNCASIIQALGRIQTERLGSILEAYLKLFEYDRPHAYECASVIQTFSMMDTKEIDSIMDGLLAFRGYGGSLPYIIASLPFIEPQNRNSYLQGVKKVVKNDPQTEVYQNAMQNLVAYTLAQCLSGDDQKISLFNYWKSILNHENKTRANYFLNFITEKYLEIGLHEEHELVQLALRIGTVIRSEEDERNPYVVYEKLQDKRDVSIDWKGLPLIKRKVGGKIEILNPRAIMAFAEQMQVDLSSVPSLTSKNFMSLLNKLQDNLKDSGQLFAGANQIAKGTKTTIDVLIKKAIDPTSHFCALMNASRESMEGSKMKCVMNWFSLMPDEEDKWLRLSTFLSSVRNCKVGKNTAIQDWYMGLPSQYRIQTKSGSFDCDKVEVPVMESLLLSIQSVVSSQFSPESFFMKKVCGTPQDEDLEQAAHQIQFVRGLIGDKVGLSEGPRFDINAGCISRNVLGLPLQDILDAYYRGITMDGFLPLLMTAFNRHVKAEAEEEVLPIYKGLKEIFEDDIELMLESDDDYKVQGVNEAGMVHLLKRVGILEEQDLNDIINMN